MLGRSKEFDGKVENYTSSIFKGYIKKIACSALVYMVGYSHHISLRQVFLIGMEQLSDKNLIRFLGYTM